MKISERFPRAAFSNAAALCATPARASLADRRLRGAASKENPRLYGPGAF
jgi:hypothetical protein